MNFCPLFNSLEVLKFVFPNDLWILFTVHALRGLFEGLKVRNLKLMTARLLEFAPNAWAFLSILQTRQMTGKHIMFNGSKQPAILPRYLRLSKVRTLSVIAAWKTKV